MLINRRSPGFSSVIIDNATALREAASLLADLGHRRIALLGGPKGAWTANQRSSAVRRWRADTTEIADLGRFDASYEGGLQAADALEHSGATAAIAFDDLMACGVIAGLAGRGIDVPGDFSIIGCDDVLISRVLTPPLTTITAPIKDLGTVAVETLDEIMARTDNTASTRKLHGTLSRRGHHDVTAETDPWLSPLTLISIEIARPTTTDSITTNGSRP